MTDTATTSELPDSRAAHEHRGASLTKLTLGAIGVVFGDIGTSPLYAFRETFAGHHPLAVDRIHVFGVLSLVFWSMMLVVTLKYISILTRADNKGEGGSLALLALISRSGGGKARWTSGIILLGVFACALFYGDSMITPAISVLSAVEGLTVVESALEPLVVPIAIVILVGLFVIQKVGTARVGALFGPVVTAACWSGSRSDGRPVRSNACAASIASCVGRPTVSAMTHTPASAPTGPVTSAAVTPPPPAAARRAPGPGGRGWRRRPSEAPPSRPGASACP